MHLLLLMLCRLQTALGEPVGAGDHRIGGLEIEQAWTTPLSALYVQLRWVLDPSVVPHGDPDLVSHHSHFRLGFWSSLLENL